MRVFLAGASGVIGRRLIPQLLAHGHQVTAMTRSPGNRAALSRLGAEPVVADALDAGAVSAAVAGARPDAVIHQLTALPARIDPRKMERDFAANDRLRSEGTRILVDAAQSAGAKRVIAQSVAFAYAPGTPGMLHDEGDPLWLDSPKAYRRTAHALAELETTVLAADGIVLRYGYFYGPGSAISSSGAMGEDVVRRRLPIVGDGGGVWSFVHVDDAAAATAAALDRGASGVYNVVDDEPARVADWIPALAQALGAPPPRRVPAMIARLAAGEFAVASMTRAQGASGARAKHELGFAPRYPSWREGFRTALD
jgi:2-alkyl-3-oxoalkanoate reductase